MNFVRAISKLVVPFKVESPSVKYVFKQTAACYSVKMQHRRPIKVYDKDGVSKTENELEVKNTARQSFKKSTSDEILGVIELDKSNVQNVKNLHREATLDEEMDLNAQDSDMASDTQDELGTSFEKLANRDSKFDRLMSSVQSKKHRKKSGNIMLEGKRLIQDAILADIIPTHIFFTQKSAIEELTMPPGVVKLLKVPYNKMKKLSLLEAPPGIIAFCKMPTNMKKKQTSGDLPITLICDNVREPGNLGTILRTVAGVGCSDIILTKGCTDLWDQKVLRSAAGAHFHVPIDYDVTWDEINESLDNNSSIFIAQPKLNSNNEVKNPTEITIPAVPYFSVNYTKANDIIVIIGGETEGISDDAIRIARFRNGVKINIPLDNNIESLNVGAAVSTILFEIKRQFMVQHH